MTGRGQDNCRTGCQVPRCRANVVKDGSYFARRKICRKHCTADEILSDNEVLRFCQQCSRIHPIDDFDASRRSCRASLAAHCERRRIRAARAGDGSMQGSLSQLTGSTCGSEDEAGSMTDPAQQADNQPGHSSQQQQQQQQQRCVAPGGAAVLSPDADEEQWLLPLHMPPLHQVLSLPQSPRSLRTNSSQQQGCRGSSPLHTAAPAAQQHTLAPGRVADVLTARRTEMHRSQGLDLNALLESQQRELTSLTAQQLERALAGQQEQRGAKRSRAAAGQDYIGPDEIPGLLGTAATAGAAVAQPRGLPQHSTLSLLLQQQQQQRGPSPQPQMSNSLAVAAQQQQLLYAQLRQQQSPPPPHLAQSAGAEHLGDALLANLGMRLGSSGTCDDSFAFQQLPASSYGVDSSRDDTVQRLMAVLKNLPPSGVPLLQQVVRHEHQQQLVSQQLAGRPLAGSAAAAAAAAGFQLNLPAGPRASSPFAAATAAAAAGASGGVVASSVTAPGTVKSSPRNDSSGSGDMGSGNGTALQRLTAVLKSLPSGSLPLLKTALHQAEQMQQPGLAEALDKQPSTTSTCCRGSFTGSVLPQAAAVSAQGQRLPAQQPAPLGGTPAALEQLLLQQQLRFDAVPAAVSAPEGRSRKRCAPAAAEVPSGLLDGLLLGTGAAGVAGLGGGAQALSSAAAPATAPLLLEQLLAPRLSGLGMQPR